ncbi:MAG: head-tail adaptor protein [Pelagimonas sp.]|jgi:head-tail adaptor|nr:head-tail adaptor protein [Pelagimonas sp.]
MVLNAGSLDRRIQILRFHETGVPSLGGPKGEWRAFGPVIFAQRRDVSDGERLSAGAWGNSLVTRFVIRATAFGRSIVRMDRINHEGATYEIDGIKEVPGVRGFLEITAKSGAK